VKAVRNPGRGILYFVELSYDFVSIVLRRKNDNWRIMNCKRFEWIQFGVGEVFSRNMSGATDIS